MGASGAGPGSLAAPSVNSSGSHSSSSIKLKLEVVATLQQSLLAKVAEGARTFFVPSMGGWLGSAASGGGGSMCKKEHRRKSITSEGPVRCV